MKLETPVDKIFSGVLMALPGILLILGVIPGFLWMYDGQKAQFVSCSLLDPPPDNVMANLSPLLLVTDVYMLILTFCYFRSQSLGLCKAVFICAVACLCISALALLLPECIRLMPYIFTPALWAVMSVIAFVRMRMEIRRYDFD